MPINVMQSNGKVETNTNKAFKTIHQTKNFYKFIACCMPQPLFIVKE